VEEAVVVLEPVTVVQGVEVLVRLVSNTQYLLPQGQI
jgi:hypothetical protein